MAGERNPLHVKVVARALALVTETMDMLDAHGSSPEAAVHLALAQEQLRRNLQQLSGPPL